MIQECIILEDEKILDALTERVEATADIEEEDKRLIKAVLYEFSPLFSGRMGRAATVQHTIDTGEAKPARTGMYRYTPSAWEEMRKQVKDLLQKQRIRASNSPWAAAVVLVPKKDGTWRFAIDYRKLNLLTKADVYPIPRIDATLDALNGAKIFTSLDLFSGYWQVAVAEEDTAKTAFHTSDGLYEWVVTLGALFSA